MATSSVHTATVFLTAISCCALMAVASSLSGYPRSMVSFEQNGYGNIIVSIDERIPEDDCVTILNNLKVLEFALLLLFLRIYTNIYVSVVVLNKLRINSPLRALIRTRNKSQFASYCFSKQDSHVRSNIRRYFTADYAS
jgi:hypothetical protein